MDKSTLFYRLADIMAELSMITEHRPSANDCVGWAQNAIDMIDKLMDDVLKEGKA
jgi:hypothetical protein